MALGLHFPFQFYYNKMNNEMVWRDDSSTGKSETINEIQQEGTFDFYICFLESMKEFTNVVPQRNFHEICSFCNSVFKVSHKVKTWLILRFEV